MFLFITKQNSDSLEAVCAWFAEKQTDLAFCRGSWAHEQLQQSNNRLVLDKRRVARAELRQLSHL
jgi:hypothetical protein